MLDQYTFLDEPSSITRDHISQYRGLLVNDHLEDGWSDPEWTAPGPQEIRTQINTNWWVIVLNDSWKVVSGQYITLLPQLHDLQMKELGSTTVLLTERRRWIATRAAQILLDKYPDTPLYSVVKENTSPRHTGIWKAILRPDQLWTFFQVELTVYWSLNWQIILANEHANALLTSQYS